MKGYASHTHKKGRGQIFTWDLIFGMILFLIALAVSINFWETAYSELRNAETEYEMNWLAETVAEQLVRTSGEPNNWTPENTVSYGLMYSDESLKNSKTRVLDPDKILYLVDAFDKNYSKVRNNLLGSSKYNVYLELYCENETNLECLQGLPLNKVTQSVECHNTQLHVSNKRTDNYYFFEAEDLWGNPTNLSCTKGCSKGNMSLVHNTGEKTINLDPGTYSIWVRPVEDNVDTIFYVDDNNFPLYLTSVPGHVNWNYMGRVNLKDSTKIGFRNTKDDTEVDALLFTTEYTYNPINSNSNTYGNPNTEQKCFIGQIQEGANIISSTKNAVVNIPDTMKQTFSGMQQINTKVTEMKVVLYEGTPLNPRDYSTTVSTPTTTLMINLPCEGPVDEFCTSNQISDIEIEDIELLNSMGDIDNTIFCGQMKNLSVYWTGIHAGDPNFFGFFIANESSVVGSCKSEEPVGGENATNYYKMNCNMTADKSKIVLADGTYDFVVTAEDMLGYCNATDSRADDRYYQSILLRDCIDYTSLSCNFDPSNYVEQCSTANNNLEDAIALDIDENIQCENSYVAHVYFKGMHSSAGKSMWTFLVEDSPGSYICVGKCRTDIGSQETNPVYYDMECTIDFDRQDCRETIFNPMGPYSIEEGTYNLYAVGDTSITGSYCANPYDSGADTYKIKQVTISECE